MSPVLLSKRSWWLVAAGLCCGLSAVGCHRPPAPAARAAAPGGRVVATVNGKVLTEADLLAKLRADSHQDHLKPEFRKNVLDLLVRDELIFQEAMRLGLDADPSYAEPVRKLEAQLAELKRSKAAEVFFQRQVAAKVQVSEAEARSYFEANQERLGTELHLFQILRRSRSSIEEAKAALDRGSSFEEVAQSALPGPALGQKPWDLGYLTWTQVPEPWRAIVDTLKPGEQSAIIVGPKDRFWILQLIDRRQTSPVFEREKDGLLVTLRARRQEALKESAEKALREQAKIVYAE